MIYSADGTRLYSPSDLVAYLEDDVAAWCERCMPSAGGKAKAAPPSRNGARRMRMKKLLSELQWARNTSRYLQQIRIRHPELVEILYGDSAASELIAATCL